VAAIRISGAAWASVVCDGSTSISTRCCSATTFAVARIPSFSSVMLSASVPSWGTPKFHRYRPIQPNIHPTLRFTVRPPPSTAVPRRNCATRSEDQSRTLL
jgi:hypothetical protein